MDGCTFFTVGHSNRDLAEFLGLLEKNGIERVLDVRKLPGSKKYPQYDEDALRSSLADHDMHLERFEALTGRRGVSENVPFEVNAWWENRSFHNYADHALSEAFADAIRALRELGHQRRVAIMCAEAVWWRCHRRIIADYLLAAGEEVMHLLGPGRIESAHLSTGAILGPDATVTYPAAH
jgi:uncharacterized protein (DUF488 family)